MMIVFLFWVSLIAFILVGVYALYLWRYGSQPSTINHELKAERKQIEQQRKEENRKRNLFEKRAYKEAHKLASRISESLAVQNRFAWNYHEYRTDQRGRRRRKKMIKFKTAVVTFTQIFYRVEGKYFPYGTSYADLLKPENEVLKNLRYDIRRACTWYEDEYYNLFLVVELRTGTMGIPKKILWARVYDKLPASRPLSVIAGQNDHEKLFYADFGKTPHWIVAGSTRMGKSTLFRQWIITLASRNPPEDVNFVLIDMKEGIELNIFRKLPHVIDFVDEPTNAIESLNQLEKERKRRMNKFRGTAQNIHGWNQQARDSDKMPHIMVFIDELSEMMIGADKAENIALLEGLARKGGAAGIYLIMGLQIVTSQILTMQIRGNAHGRICFALPQYSESINVLGNGMASTIDIAGRCIYRDGVHFHMLQSPIAFDNEVKGVVDHWDETIDSADGDSAPTADLFGFHDLLRIARDNYGGALAWEPLFHDPNVQLSANKIKTVIRKNEFDFAIPDESVIELDGQRYIITPHYRKTITGQTGTTPRYLFPVNGLLPKDSDEMFSLLAGFVQKTTDNGQNPIIEEGM